MRTSLVPSLYAALAGYRSAFERGGNVRDIARSIDAKLGDQPPATIANADGEIANVAGLTWWRPKQSFFQRVFRTRSSESQLLLSTPGLEYLYMFHRDGRLREQALNRIHGPLPNQFLFAAVVWRLNDWVPQVRASAQRCAHRCLGKTSPEILARFFLSAVRQMATWRRWTDSERDLIYSQVRRPDVIAEMARLLTYERAGPLPSTLAHVIQYPEIDSHLENLARNAIHPGVRSIALRTLIDGKARFAVGTQWHWINKPMGIRRKEPKIETRDLTIGSNRKELIRHGVKDKSAIVRRVALSGIIAHERHEPEFVSLAREYLSDQSPSVRSRAEFVIRTAAGIERNE